MQVMTGLDVVRRVADLRARIAAWRSQGLRIGLVPTMGALHEGHFSLIERSVETTDRTIVTLFVNPRQFGPNEDFARYPRTEAQDASHVRARGAHLLFAPEVGEMYPTGAVTTITVPGLGDTLEGEFRPGFFAGVATVVTKLLIQSLPDNAFFGEKDYQQLLVVKRLAADLDLPVRIVGCPIVREADGLALSSRNAYLDAAERARAPALNHALTAAAARVREGGAAPRAEAEARERLLQAGFAKVDYVAVRDAATLGPVSDIAAARVLGAAWLGRTRLIDNVAIGP